MGEMADDFSPGGRCAPEEDEDQGINDPEDIADMLGNAKAEGVEV